MKLILLLVAFATVANADWWENAIVRLQALFVLKISFEFRIIFTTVLPNLPEIFQRFQR